MTTFFVKENKNFSQADFAEASLILTAEAAKEIDELSVFPNLNFMRLGYKVPRVFANSKHFDSFMNASFL